MPFKFLQVLVVEARPVREFFLRQFFVRAQPSERLGKILGNLVH